MANSIPLDPDTTLVLTNSGQDDMLTFNPNLSVSLPQQVMSATLEGDAGANLKALRSQYQQALLRWLRQENPAAALQQMQQALVGVMCNVPQDEGRAFWWIGCGLLDCLKLGGLPPELNSRKLLGRIDQQIRTVAEGKIADALSALKEMLYLVGRSHAVSETVEEIKRLYALDDYLPETSTRLSGEVASPTTIPEVAPLSTEVAQMLSNMRDQLRVAEESWERAVQGDESSCEQFMKHAEQLVLLSEKLDRDSLQPLANKIHMLSKYASTPEHARPIAIDMAMALLLLGSGTENYSRLDSGYQEQARILSERMQAAVKQQPEDARQMSELVDLHYQMEQAEVMIPLANEMLVNLQHVEQGLNAYFNGSIQREELSGLLRLLNQIQGGLHISSLDKAEQLLVSIRDEVRGFEQSKESPKSAVRHALADAMSTLENYMQHLTHGKTGDVSRLQKASGEIVKAHLAPIQSAPIATPQVAAPVASIPVSPPPLATPVASIPITPIPIALPVTSIPVTPPPVPAQRSDDESQELIDIFLEEAQEVLASMRSNLDVCQLHPDSIDPLVTIRRGFHTLKGSGRMVGLIDLGEVAWSVERAMNKWLEEKKPANPGLLHFISSAVQAFTGWVDVLSNQGVLQIEANELIATAEQIEHGAGVEITPAPVEPVASLKMDIEPSVQPESTPPPDLVFDFEAATPSEPAAEPESISLAELEFESEISPAAEPETMPSPELDFDFKAEPLTKPESTQLPELDLNFEATPNPEPEPGALSELDFDFKTVPFVEPESMLSPGLDSEFGVAPLPEPELPSELNFILDKVQLAVPDLEAEPSPLVGLELDAEAMPKSESEEDMVVIGDIALSQGLFNIASSEAVQNVAILQEQFDNLREAMPPVVEYDFMRAAHTLVGLHRTMGFEMVVELAYALEAWLRARMDQPFTLSEGQLQMIDQTISDLGEMVLSICDQQIPQNRGDLVGQLHADMDNFGATDTGTMQMPAAEILSIEVEQFEPVENPIEVELPRMRDESGGIKEITFDSAVIPGPAAPAPAVSPSQEHDEVEVPQIQDDIEEELLPVFLEEADELCPQIGEGLRAWRENPQDEQHLQLLKRLLHTMKGSSRMVGAMRIGEIAHKMEDQVSADDQAREKAGYWDALDSDFDLVNALLEELRGGEVVVMPTTATAMDAVEIRQDDIGRRESDKQVGVPKVDRRAADQGVERAALGNVLRVRSDVVDKLVNDAGEISVARSRMETELRTFKDGLKELTASVMRLRHQLREVEIQAESQMQARVSLAKDSAEQFDPLEFDRFTRLQELTRFMNESVHDVQTVQRALLKNLDETSVVLQVQGRLSRELQQNLMNVRMVSFSSVSDRLYRIVRQTGKEMGKRANLELQGTGVELDRSVLEKMIAPFEHLLRNSIVHGLENDKLRVQIGKNPLGEIRLSVRQESNEVVFEFSDDGAGLNYERLREKGVAKGLFREGEVVSEEQLAQLIFAAGLSTANEISEVAGRGVGMDVVRSEIATLGGTIDVKSKTGIGTQFIIRLPLTLAVTQILLVRSGESIYAIPSAMVEQVRQVKAAEMNNLNSERSIEWQDKNYPLHYLSQLLSESEVAQENHPRNPVLLLRSGDYRIALHVDELLGNQEAVVKNIGPQLARLSGIAGATVLGNGAVVLILNPPQLAQHIGISRAGKAVKAEATAYEAGAEAAASVKPLNSMPLIMVVDDSLTVRKITSRMLTRAGYQVVTATDGIDALEQLADFTPDVMLLDIEMPRMDGFALARELRRDPKTQGMPIIMITSRTADKHRDYAIQLGVNTYLGKPYQEDELLQNIADFVAVHKLDA